MGVEARESNEVILQLQFLVATYKTHMVSGFVAAVLAGCIAVFALTRPEESLFVGLGYFGAYPILEESGPNRIDFVRLGTIHDMAELDLTAWQRSSRPAYTTYLEQVFEGRYNSLEDIGFSISVHSYGWVLQTEGKITDREKHREFQEKILGVLLDEIQAMEAPYRFHMSARFDLLQQKVNGPESQNTLIAEQNASILMMQRVLSRAISEGPSSEQSDGVQVSGEARVPQVQTEEGWSEIVIELAEKREKQALERERLEVLLSTYRNIDPTHISQTRVEKIAIPQVPADALSLEFKIYLWAAIALFAALIVPFISALISAVSAPMRQET